MSSRGLVACARSTDKVSVRLRSPRLPSITRLLARGGDSAPVIPRSTRQPSISAGATASVLLRPDPTTGRWSAVSGAGLETLTLGPWLATAPGAQAAERALAGRPAVVLASLETERPELADRLRAPSCALVPLVGAEQPVGLWLLALPPGLAPDLNLVATIGDVMVIALDRARAADELALHREVRDLREAFARGGASSLTLTPALEAMCRGVARLMAADAVEVWQHDRRARELVLAATSNPHRRVSRLAVPTSDLAHPVAASLRRDRPELVAAPGAHVLGTNIGLVAPLRGRRRALGVLAVHGIRLEPGGEAALLDRASELGRQLSAIFENVQLLDDVLRSRAELDNVFNSLADLVAVTDGAGRIVETNRAFATRVGQARDALVDQRLGDLLSPALAEWIDAQRGDATAAVGAIRGMRDPHLGGIFDLTVTPLAGIDPGAGGLVFVARDVTIQAQLEEERAVLERRLGQSEKLMALGQFVAGVAHELNNPLQGVLGHLELVRASRTLPASVRRDLALVYREADRAARIVHNLLVFAGSGRVRRRPLAVNAVVARALNCARGRTRRRRSTSGVSWPRRYPR